MRNTGDLPAAQHDPLNNSRYSQITSAHAPHHEHMNAHGHTADTHGSCARLRAAPAACEDEYDPDGEDQAEPLEGEPLLRVRVRARARARLRVSTRHSRAAALRDHGGGLELGVGVSGHGSGLGLGSGEGWGEGEGWGWGPA